MALLSGDPAPEAAYYALKCLYAAYNRQPKVGSTWAPLRAVIDTAMRRLGARSYRFSTGCNNMSVQPCPLASFLSHQAPPLLPLTPTCLPWSSDITGRSTRIPSTHTTTTRQELNLLATDVPAVDGLLSVLRSSEAPHVPRCQQLAGGLLWSMAAWPELIPSVAQCSLVADTLVHSLQAKNCDSGVQVMP